MIKDSEFDFVGIKGRVAGGKVSSFPCSRCGVCCSKYQVLLTKVEEQQIADGLSIRVDEFLDRYTDHRWGGTESFLLRHQDGACIFLSHVESSRVTNCSIYGFKPSDCKAYSPDPCKPECQQGLRNQGAYYALDYRQP
jgi:Fe-S-cluster containining protein